MPAQTMYLLCEGPTDKRVLDNVLNSKLGLQVLVKAVGGEDIPRGAGNRGSGSIRAYLERETRGVVAVSIQDRNFLSAQKVDRGWQDKSCKTLLWHRHELENYLLEPKVVLDAFTRLRNADDENVARRHQKLPADQETIVNLLHEAAKQLFEDHAARMVEWALCSSSTTLRGWLTGYDGSRRLA